MLRRKHFCPRVTYHELFKGVSLLDKERLLMSLSALQAQQFELQRQRATDSLKKGLAARPEKDELIDRE